MEVIQISDLTKPVESIRISLPILHLAINCCTVKMFRKAGGTASEIFAILGLHVPFLSLSEVSGARRHDY